MAQQYVTSSGALIIPGAYSSYRVQTANSGLATSGVLMLVGEAESGPSFAEESDLSENAFGPDQLAQVVAKYKAGPLVDAFRAASVPANDPDIVGAPSRFIMVKTNASTKASATLSRVGGGDYATVFDKSYGRLGNLIYVDIDDEVAEVSPTTGSFTFIPPVSTGVIDFAVNGVLATADITPAAMTPAAFVAAVDAVTGVAATGGAKVTLTLSNGQTLDLVKGVGNAVTVTYSAAFANPPVVGGTLVIPTASCVAGADSANVGAYVITGVVDSVIYATKLSDAGKGGAVVGAVTAPVNVAGGVVDDADDIIVYGPVSISSNADAINGGGKSLEIAVGSGTDSIANCAYVLGTTTKVSWVSTSAAPYVIKSGAERKVKLTASRSLDGISEELSVGGDVVFAVGYNGASSTATMAITATTLTTTIDGVAGTPLTLADFPTIGDLVAYLNTTSGFKAEAGSGIFAQLPTTCLDKGTFAIASVHGAAVGRVKNDGYKFHKKVTEESVLVQLNNPSAAADAGLPVATSTAVRLSGGTKGGTTNVNVTSAFAALERVRGNFLVPLFSRNATADIADGLTDSSSTYTIESINTEARAHVLKMSTLKRMRNRQAFLSFKGTFAEAKAAAGNIASYRCAMPFQDCRNVGANGIQQFPSWMLAAVAAGSQAAAFYKAIVNKGLNVSGVLQAAGDFSDQDDTNLEDALLAGLLPVRRDPTGGFRWVSDQTTYGKDNNFVFNSIQAVYVADIIATTTAQRMERAFVGQSVADVSAAVAMTYLETIMGDFLRLKLIAPSSDATRGYRNASIQINGPAMIVSVEVKLAGAIYFIPISFLVSQVQQTA